MAGTLKRLPVSVTSVPPSRSSISFLVVAFNHHRNRQTQALHRLQQFLLRSARLWWLRMDLLSWSRVDFWSSSLQSKHQQLIAAIEHLVINKINALDRSKPHRMQHQSCAIHRLSIATHQQSSLRGSVKTVRRWRANRWRPLARELHPLDAARVALDDAVPVLTSDPLTTVESLSR
jgi:hypothetical protein